MAHTHNRAYNVFKFVHRTWNVFFIHHDKKLCFIRRIIILVSYCVRQVHLSEHNADKTNNKHAYLWLGVDRTAEDEIHYACRRPMLVSLVVHMRHALSIYVCEVRDDHSSSSSRMRQLLPPRITSILLRSARALHHRCMCVCSLFLIVRPGAFGSTQSTHTNNYTCK